MAEQALLARVIANGMPMSAGGDLAASLVARGLLTAPQAARAVEEYARFMALKGAGHAVMAPPLITEIWLEHLKDSAAYFDRFCTPVFGKPIHYEPGRSGAMDLAATLATYEAAFDSAPPDDIWPTSQRMRGVRVWEWIAAGGFFVGAGGYVLERYDLFWLGTAVVLVGLFGVGLRMPLQIHRETGPGGD